MNKITMDDFKENKVFVIITLILGVVGAANTIMKPEYFSGTVATLSAIIVFPFYAWWFMRLWNKILVKLFSLKTISYGVAILLSGIIWAVGL